MRGINPNKMSTNNDLNLCACSDEKASQEDHIEGCVFSMDSMHMNEDDTEKAEALLHAAFQIVRQRPEVSFEVLQNAMKAILLTVPESAKESEAAEDAPEEAVDEDEEVSDDFPEVSKVPESSSASAFAFSAAAFAATAAAFTASAIGFSASYSTIDDFGNHSGNAFGNAAASAVAASLLSSAASIAALNCYLSSI